MEYAVWGCTAGLCVGCVIIVLTCTWRCGKAAGKAEEMAEAAEIDAESVSAVLTRVKGLAERVAAIKGVHPTIIEGCE